MIGKVYCNSCNKLLLISKNVKESEIAWHERIAPFNARCKEHPSDSGINSNINIIWEADGDSTKS